MFRVLRAEYEQTGERTTSGQPFYRVARWVQIGTAHSMEEAKRLHPCPVLEVIGRVH